MSRLPKSERKRRIRNFFKNLWWRIKKILTKEINNINKNT